MVVNGYKVNLLFDFETDQFWYSLSSEEQLLWLYLSNKAVRNEVNHEANGVFTNVKSIARSIGVVKPQESIDHLVEMGALIPTEIEL